MEVEFMGDSIMVVKMKDTGKTYVGVNWICTALGFDKNDRDIEIRRIKSDTVLLKGATLMSLPTKGGNQQSWVLEMDYLTLWLAKINVDSKRKQRTPDTMEKLIEYQLKAKDILAQAFLKKKEDWNLQREVGKIDSSENLDNGAKMIAKYINNNGIEFTMPAVGYAIDKDGNRVKKYHIDRYERTVIAKDIIINP
jgi:hypothetical protein